MNLVNFDFKGANVRTVTDENGEVLFVGKDVCGVLGYTNHSKAISDNCRGLTASYPILDSLGRTQTVRVLTEGDVLRLVVKSNLPAAVEFERWVFEEVLPSIRKTGSYSHTTQDSFDKELKLLETYKRMMSLSESAAITLTHRFGKQAGINTSFLPTYANDGEGASKSATELLNGRMSTVTFNKKLHAIGYLVQNTRKSSCGEPKKFWTIAGEGLNYGKNAVYPDNPLETKPQWFVDKFEELLSKVK